MKCKLKIKRKLLSLIMAAVLVSTLVPAAYAASLADSGSSTGSKAAVWDGKTIDVSWYSASAKTMYISTPAQMAGLAAIVNGIYNTDITNVTGDSSIISKVVSETENSGSNGQNMSTSSYYCGTEDFNGKTVCLTADIDMGGVYNAATDSWSGPNYMPVGGQYLMTPDDTSTKISSSFCGVFDGQGHTVYNIYCNRRCTTGNYGDGQSIGLIGRLGVHDNDDSSLRPKDPTVKNVTVTGYIYGNRSIGGIVGKIGKTSVSNGDGSNGGIIENCANFATVENTDAKGCGGICGAAWNAGVIRNCYNAGNVRTSYVCPTAGIAGSNEISIENCYNIGSISALQDNYAMAIGTNNGGAPYEYAVKNSYYLDGSAPGGGYYSSGTRNSETAMTASAMKQSSFVKKLGSAYTEDTYGINNGYPVLVCQAENAKALAASAQTPSATNPSAGNQSADGNQTGTGSSSTITDVSLYTDIFANSWYYEYVKYVTENNYFDAFAGVSFGPEQPMTRSMLVTALYRMAGSPQVTGNTSFTDVAASASYADAVLWANQNNIVNGMSEISFSPDGNITREQIAAMFYRYAGYAGKDLTVSDSLSVYSDTASISSWALENVKWAVGAGLINGMTSTTIGPKGTTTRAQAAAMVMRLADFTA